MNKVRGYIFSRPFLGERVPQSVQNLVIRDYCIKNNLSFLLSATEYAMKNSDLMLFKILNEINNLDGIVGYSLFQLPEDNYRRIEALKTVINSNKTFYFALENIRVNSLEKINSINELWNIKNTLPNCIVNIK